MNSNMTGDGRTVGPGTPSLPRQRSLPESHAQATQHHLNGFKVLVGELKARQFDRIRFAAYRTASKLRYIQKRTQFVLVDLWNVIEAFRQVGLNAVDSLAELDVVATEEVLRAIYAQLNKRLPAERRVDAHECIDILLSWILHTYDPTSRSYVRVLSLKVVLSTLASGKSIDKFKYHFTLLSDPSGGLLPQKFEQYLHDLLSLAVGVFEGSNFTYDSEASKFMLNGKSRTVVIEEYLDRMMMDPGPQCLLWLTIFHRCSHVERVRHQVRCSVCGKEPIVGFRYKCQRCHNFSLCQECFWTGAVSGSHTLQHEVKEYTAWKTHSRQFGHSLRRSFHCGKPSNSSNSTNTKRHQQQQQMQHPQHLQHQQQMMQQHPQQQQFAQVRRLPPGTTTDLNAVGPQMGSELRNPRMEGIIASCSHPAIHASATVDRQIAAPSPSRSLAGHPMAGGNAGSGGSPPLVLPPSSVSASPPLYAAQNSSSANRPAGFPFDPNCVDDEHRLISRYASRLAADVDLPLGSRPQNKSNSTGEILIPPTSVKDQRALIAKLEAKNREILKEIQRLRLEQQATANGPGLLGGCSSPSAVTNNPTLLVELRALRQRKDELETRMGNLQDSRKELMLQLESLMKLLKTGGKEGASNGSGPPPSSSSGGLAPSSTPPALSQRATPVSGSPLRSLSMPCTSAGSPLILPSAGTAPGATTPGFSYASVPPSPQPFPSAAYAPGMAPGSLRRDLLLAADSVTTAMSSLVRELNSDASSPDESGARGPIGIYEAECERALEDMSRSAPGAGPSLGGMGGAHNGVLGPQMVGVGGPGAGSWQRRRQLQEQRFLSELRARRHQRSGSYTPGGYGPPGPPVGFEHGSASSDGEAFLYSDPECGAANPGYASLARNFTDDEMELAGGKMLRHGHTRFGSTGRGSTGSGVLVTAQDDSAVPSDFDGSLMRDDIPRSMGWSVPTSSSCLNSR